MNSNKKTLLYNRIVVADGESQVGGLMKSLTFGLVIPQGYIGEFYFRDRVTQTKNSIARFVQYGDIIECKSDLYQQNEFTCEDVDEISEDIENEPTKPIPVPRVSITEAERNNYAKRMHMSKTKLIAMGMSSSDAQREVNRERFRSQEEMINKLQSTMEIEQTRLANFSKKWTAIKEIMKKGIRDQEIVHDTKIQPDDDMLTMKRKVRQRVERRFECRPVPVPVPYKLSPVCLLPVVSAHKDYFESKLLEGKVVFHLNSRRTGFVSTLLDSTKLDDAFIPGLRSAGIDAMRVGDVFLMRIPAANLVPVISESTIMAKDNCLSDFDTIKSTSERDLPFGLFYQCLPEDQYSRSM